MDRKVYREKRITNFTKHHFFGFHDLIQSNYKDTKILCLETDTINRPPIPGEAVSLGYVSPDDEMFMKLGSTNAFNYPQGARQQWIQHSDSFIVNNQVRSNWGSDVYDTRLGKKIESYSTPVYCLTQDGKTAFGINYSRLHRLGGYGYIGIRDETENDTAPENDGISLLELNSGRSSLIISINSVANFQPLAKVINSHHHYVTHLRLNPSDTRIAFLHRYFLPDGGYMTRLMTINTDGTNLRCLAFGFLSHFEWLDSESIIIYGRTNRNIDNIRGNIMLNNRVSVYIIKHMKSIVKELISKSSNNLKMSFLQIKDSGDKMVDPFWENVILEDGHPMINPLNPKWIVCDTYPDKNDTRELFVLDYTLGEKISIGRFGFSDKHIDMSLSNKFFRGIDTTILKNIDPIKTAFFRSGLHCDLHPRWLSNGQTIAFDSIHEGTRQIYTVNVSDIISADL